MFENNNACDYLESTSPAEVYIATRQPHRVLQLLPTPATHCPTLQQNNKPLYFFKSSSFKINNAISKSQKIGTSRVTQVLRKIVNFKKKVSHHCFYPLSCSDAVIFIISRSKFNKLLGCNFLALVSAFIYERSVAFLKYLREYIFKDLTHF